MKRTWITDSHTVSFLSLTHLSTKVWGESNSEHPGARDHPEIRVVHFGLQMVKLHGPYGPVQLHLSNEGLRYSFLFLAH